VSWRFGRFVLDRETRELLLDGEDVHLSPKAFELLTTLVVNRSRAMSKAELQERLWPSTFVEETNLASLAAEVRRALRDSPRQPAFLRTVYGFGYRFVGEVTEKDSDAAPVPRLAERLYLIVNGRRTRLVEGTNLIGRAPDVSIQCDAVGVSRHHARVLVANGTATLQDLGSKNGTFLQKTRITSARLSDGDEIRLGKQKLTFRIEAPIAPTETLTTDAGD